jgi:hypothetical protein
MSNLDCFNSLFHFPPVTPTNIRIPSDNTRIQSDNTRIQSDNTRIQSDNTRIQSDNTRIQSDQGPSPSERLSSYLETRRQQIDNFNMQNSGGNTSLRNATAGPLSQDHGASISIAMTTSIVRPFSNAPPSYDDVMQQMAITTTIEGESSSPPTYTDFIRRTYRSEGWS